jgi:hypothetical protein
MILDYFYLFHAQFFYEIVCLKNFESHMLFVDLCAPVKIANSAQKSVLQALQFQEFIIRRVVPGETDINHY